MDKKEQFFMRKALEEASNALKKDEVPVGAVIVFQGQIISRAFNQCVQSNDPTAHAEITAIRKACQKQNNYRLNDCDIYVTLEPCPMCVGAVVQARMKTLVYGASDPKGGGVCSLMDFPFEKTNHSIEIKSGILIQECGRILKDYFKSKR
ncbi:MAG: tRNA-specific adenosine deaminase [Candidatus Aminicenantes bacterium]|nr:tRNA-specific adenosine deaminase [Candidatus Aminicenantes bacterium]